MSWTLRTADLDDLARGAALLGTGGGGDPFVGKMLVTQALGEAGEITILDPEELDDDAWVIPVAQMGAPTVVVDARSTPFTNSTLFFFTRSSARYPCTVTAIWVSKSCVLWRT